MSSYITIITVTALFSLVLILQTPDTGHASGIEPIQVNGQLDVGGYKITPPDHYWFFPKRYIEPLKTKSGLFVITFWESEEAALSNFNQKNDVLFNFALSSKTYKNYQSFYKDAETKGFQRQTLDYLGIEDRELVEAYLKEI